MRKTGNKFIKPDARQTRVAGGSFSDRTHAYFDLHAHAFFSSLGRLVRAPFTSLMTITVLAIAIALAASFYLLVSNLEQLTGKLDDGNHISLFLKENIADSQGKVLAEKIKKMPGVDNVKVITKDQALAEFKEYSGFGDALNALEKNPLPTVIQVLPKTGWQNEQLDKLLNLLQARAEVDFAQLDMQWIKKLQSIMELASRAVTLVSIVLGCGVLFIAGNTIRLELHNRRDEVVIAKLVGATQSFIQRPFLYIGFWLGFFSGIAAWMIVTIMMFFIQQPINRLSELYDGVFQILYLGFFETLSLIMIASLLGILGSWIVLCYQLQQLKPE